MILFITSIELMFLFLPIESWITNDWSNKDKSSVDGSALEDGTALVVEIKALLVGGIELKSEDEDVVITLLPLLFLFLKNKEQLNILKS